MSAIFLKEDATSILHNKFVVVMGSSVQRSIYKDLVRLLQGNQYLTDGQLRSKGEHHFLKDELLEGGRKGQMTNGTNYREVRQYKTDYHLVRFHFITRAYNSYVETVIRDLGKGTVKPDVIIINSCLWDITRYGTSGVSEYKKNLDKLCLLMKEVLPENCTILWNTTLPVSKLAKGGFLIPEVEFMNNNLRLEVLEANFFARQCVVSHGFDVIDLHYYMRHHLHRRAEDGIHWDMTAHRRMTNLIMTHLTEVMDGSLPDRIHNISLNNNKDNIPGQHLDNISKVQPKNKNQEVVKENNPVPVKQRSPTMYGDGLNAKKKTQMTKGQNVNARRKAAAHHQEQQMMWFEDSHHMPGMHEQPYRDYYPMEGEYPGMYYDFNNMIDPRTLGNVGGYQWQPYADQIYCPPGGMTMRYAHQQRNFPYMAMGPGRRIRGKSGYPQ